jgi:hypothetical protein
MLRNFLKLKINLKFKNMPIFVKTGFWEKVSKSYKGWLNLDDLIVEIAPTSPTRSISITSASTLTPNIDLYDLFVISAQAEALIIANPTGTAVLGNGFMIDLEDDGSARAITYGNLYDDTFVDLPSTTIAGKRMKLVFQYNGTNWELLNVINEQ